MRQPTIKSRYACDLLLSCSRDIILIFDSENGQILEANTAAVSAYGYSREAFLGMTVHDLRTDIDKAWTQSQMAQAYEHGLLFETVHRKKSGDTFPVEVSSRGAMIGGRHLLISIIRDITERKLSEQALRISEEKFSKAFHDSPGFMSITDAQTGKYQMVNRAYCELTGYSAEELIGNTSLDLGILSAESRAEMMRTLDAKGGIVNYENRIQTKTGQTRTRILSASVLKIQGEQSILITGIDVTDHRFAESELRDSEERFRLFMDSSPAIAWIKDESGRYVYINKTVGTRFDFDADQVLGKTDADLFSPDLADQYRKNDLAAMKAGHAITVTERAAEPDGKVSYMASSKFCMQDSAGNRFVAGIGMDITERLRAQKALQKSERRLSLAISATADAIWEWNPLTQQTYFSPRWYEMLGYRDQEIPMTFQGWKKLCHPEDFQPTMDLIQTCLESPRDQVYAAEFRMQAKNGAWLWILGRGRVVQRDEQGQAVLLSGTNTDITQRKKIEGALRQLNETLEQRVAERTMLAETRARQLQALAVELIETEERERGRLAEILHEDVQQMLASARMQFEAACEQFPVTPLLRNVANLLGETVSKIRKLSHELSPAVLSLGGLLPALHYLIQQMQEQFGLQVELVSDIDRSLDRKPLKVFVFRSVQELLFNVVKHSGKKNARVELSSTDHSVVFCVSDKGPGFDPQSLESFAAQTGLGLISLKERVRYIGGKMKIDSGPGKGCRITVTVPVDLTNDTKTFAFSEKSENKSLSRRRGDDVPENMRVLVVDDHDVMRKGLSNLISKHPDIQVVGEAADGVDAIDQARQLNPDVVIMDVSMPKMSGIEATRQVKAELPHVRVIGLSMHDDDAVAQSMYDAGAEGFLNKGCSPDEIVGAIVQIGRRDRHRAV